MADLLDELGDPSQPQALPVDEIWALDAVNQGDSGVLNEAVLGKACECLGLHARRQAETSSSTVNWADHGRDILNFIVSYLDTPTATPSSTHLPALVVHPSLLELDHSRPTEGPSPPPARVWRDRLIVGIGHSLGGGGMAYASTASPSVFSSVILCDPVLPWPELDRSVAGLTKGAIVRRAEWSSKEEAKEGFLKKAFFRQWDPRVLDSYCTFGVKELPSGGVALKTRAQDEAVSHALHGVGSFSADSLFIPARLLRSDGGCRSARLHSTRIAPSYAARPLRLRRREQIGAQRGPHH